MHHHFQSLVAVFTISAVVVLTNSQPTQTSIQQLVANQLSQAGPAGAPSESSSSDGTNAACCAQLTAIGFNTSLPVVIANSTGKAVTRDRTQTSQICTCSTNLEKGDVNMTAVFRIRGGTNSQLQNRLSQFAIDIDDKKWFLGMPKSKKWMLYAQDLDPFGIHNWFGFELARLTGEYAIRTQYCELFVVDNGANTLNISTHYRGVYVAMEKPRQEKNRVNISDNKNASDITGGYMAEFKHGQNPDNLPTINGSQSLQQWNVEYPKKDEITEAQLNYFQSYLNKFEEALYKEDNWRDFAAESNWVNWFLAIEFIKNTKHSYHSSPWMFKDVTDNKTESDAGKLHLGPLWGNVQGFGTCCAYPVKYYNNSGEGPANPLSGGNGISSSGWLFRVCLNDFCPALDKYAAGYGISPWFQYLWKDEKWVRATASRWNELRAGNWSDSNLKSKLDAIQKSIQPAALRTYTRWPHLLQSTGSNSQLEAFNARFLNLWTWISQRAKWLDSAFEQAKDPKRTQGNYPSEFASPGTAG